MQSKFLRWNNIYAWLTLSPKVPKTTVDSQDNDVVDWELQLLVDPLPNQLVGDQRVFHRTKAHKV